MTLPAAPAPPTAMGSRFFFVGYLSTYIALLFLLVLAWADHGPGTSFKRAWQTASKLTAAQIIFIVFAVFLIAVLTGPFQLALVRVFEGAWPRRIGGGRKRKQKERKRQLEIDSMPRSSDPTELWRAGTAGHRLRLRYPLPDHTVRATRLGNVLAAMEDRAGRDYGLDAVVAWPRLYPLLGAATKAIVDDRRTTLDTMARLAATALVTAVGAAVILADARWWFCLVLAPVALSVIAYLAAIQAALAYSESVQAAFDLHHLSLATAFGLARPATSAAERIINRQLCDLWRQSVPHLFTYAPSEQAEDSSGGRPA